MAEHVEVTVVGDGAIEVSQEQSIAWLLRDLEDEEQWLRGRRAHYVRALADDEAMAAEERHEIEERLQREIEEFLA